MKRMIEIILHYYNLDSIQIKGRKGSLKDAKHMARYILRKEFELELKFVAVLTGAVNHSSVISSIKRLEDLMDTDKDILNDYLNLMSMYDGCIPLDRRWRRIKFVKPARRNIYFFIRKDGEEFFFSDYKKVEEFLGITRRAYVHSIANRMARYKGWQIFNEYNRPLKGRKQKVKCRVWKN